MVDSAPQEQTLQIHPTQLFSNDPDYQSEIKRSGFCWRWLTRINNDNSQFRVLTIEDSNQKADPEASNDFLPENVLTTLTEYYGEIKGHYFNWRWFTVDNGGKYKVVTIEDFDEDLVEKKSDA